MQSIQTRQSDFIEPPMFGGVTCLAASATPVTVDLTSLAGSPGNQVTGPDVATGGGKNPNPIGHYFSLQADGGDVYISFGDTVNDLSTIANTTAVSTVTNNKATTTSTVNGVIKIFNGTTVNYKIPEGPNPNATGGAGVWGASSPARFLCFLTSTGTATLRVWQSSP